MPPKAASGEAPKAAERNNLMYHSKPEAIFDYERNYENQADVKEVPKKLVQEMMVYWREEENRTALSRLDPHVRDETAMRKMQEQHVKLQDEVDKIKLKNTQGQQTNAAKDERIANLLLEIQELQKAGPTSTGDAANKTNEIEAEKQAIELKAKKLEGEVSAGKVVTERLGIEKATAESELEKRNSELEKLHRENQRLKQKNQRSRVQKGAQMTAMEQTSLMSRDVEGTLDLAAIGKGLQEVKRRAQDNVVLLGFVTTRLSLNNGISLIERDRQRAVASLERAQEKAERHKEWLVKNRAGMGRKLDILDAYMETELCGSWLARFYWYYQDFDMTIEITRTTLDIHKKIPIEVNKVGGFPIRDIECRCKLEAYMCRLQDDAKSQRQEVAVA